jgi:hypothetical protein
MASRSTGIAGTVIEDEGRRRARAKSMRTQRPGVDYKVANFPHAQRDTSDQVNRFLLCVLVGESAKRIRAAAARAGESLPITKIIKGVLRAYRLAAAQEGGPLAGNEPDLAAIEILNAKILRDEIASLSQERLKTSEARLARAKSDGDDTRIRAEESEIERGIELRDSMAKRFR